jgi:malate/lactate dehydrogenase
MVPLTATRGPAGADHRTARRRSPPSPQGREAGRRIVEGHARAARSHPSACISKWWTIVRDSKRICGRDAAAGRVRPQRRLRQRPGLIGKGGVEKIYQLKLDEADLKLFRHSAEVVMDSQKAVLRVEDMTRALDLL